MWESSRLKKGGSTGYPSFSTKNQNFFSRHMRRFSSSLPRFNGSPYYADKEKLGRGRWSVHNVPLLGRMRGIMARMGRKMKMRLLILLMFLLSIIVFYNSRECQPVLAEFWTTPG
jgi:mannan polymerase II complex MNN10 subunit